MKKILLGLGAVLLIALIVIPLTLGNIVRSAIVTFGPDALGVPVTVEDVDISIFTGIGNVENLVIGSPEGYRADYAMKLGQLSFDVDLPSLFSNDILINEIKIISPEIVYEVGLGSSNISALSKGSSGKETSSSSSSGSSSEEGESAKVIIENLYITDATLTPAIVGAGAPIPVPNIHMQDIGKDSGGSNPAEIILLVFTTILSTIQTLDLSSILSGVGDGVKGVADGLKGLLGGE